MHVKDTKKKRIMFFLEFIIFCVIIIRTLNSPIKTKTFKAVFKSLQHYVDINQFSTQSDSEKCMPSNPKYIPKIKMVIFSTRYFIVSCTFLYYFSKIWGHFYTTRRILKKQKLKT